MQTYRKFERINHISPLSAKISWACCARWYKIPDFFESFFSKIENSRPIDILRFNINFDEFKWFFYRNAIFFEQEIGILKSKFGTWYSFTIFYIFLIYFRHLGKGECFFLIPSRSAAQINKMFSGGNCVFTTFAKIKLLRIG